MNSLFIVLKFFRFVFFSMRMDHTKNKLDFFSNRLLKASSEPSLAKAIEHLLRAVDADIAKIDEPSTIDAITVASSHDGPRVLRWIRENSKVAAMLSVATEKNLESIASTITLPESLSNGQAEKRGNFDITVRANTESALSHGAEGKVGNSTMFRRIHVRASNGSILELPYYSGNAIRGLMRDLLADHFIESIGVSSHKSDNKLSLWFFYALYSGGALEENSSAMKALKGRLGNNGAIRSDGIREFRESIPPLSLLGCALGNRVLSGRIQVSDLRPECYEWGNGDTPVSEIMAWEFLTRREDDEGHSENHSMIANTEVVRAGVCFEGGIDMESMSVIEKSCLGKGLDLLEKRGFIGAENRRGLGKVRFSFENSPDPKPYEDWISENKESIISYLNAVDALKDGLL